MKKFRYLTILTLAAFFSIPVHAQDSAATYQGKVGKTLADSKEWWPEPVHAPKDAPNVIWIILDDVDSVLPPLSAG